MESNLLLSAKDLTIGYHNNGVKNILFENLEVGLRPGELVCFMGPNGVGKSTLIRTLAGLHPPLSPLQWGLKGGDPQKISVVLTDKVSAVNMTVEELVTYGRYPYLDWNIKLSKSDSHIIEKAIEVTRIQHLISKKLYELSDGQMQMAMIARALAQNTPVILLDEPTAHLDLNNRVEIMNLLRRLSRTESKAILVATHELDLALQTADVVWLASRDKKILTGIPEDLVLNGSFDSVFQFKGFDLKTGKVSHETFRNISINLVGEGHHYLWTKNALERCGYDISEKAKNTIIITEKDNQVHWVLRDQTFTTIKELLNALPKV
jgi:iron complex transport system ATP-binding protein